MFSTSPFGLGTSSEVFVDWCARTNPFTINTLGFSTQCDFFGSFGRSKDVFYFGVQEFLNSVAPNWGGASDPRGNRTHGGIVIIPNPGCDKNVLGIAKGPVVAEIVGGACFDGDLVIWDVEYGVKAKSG